jgi:hypothetical protein
MSAEPDLQTLKREGRYLGESGGLGHEYYEYNGRKYVAYFDRRGVHAGGSGSVRETTTLPQELRKER